MSGLNKHPLRAFREQQEPPWTQEQLAAFLDASKAAVSRWESGARRPDEKACRNISKRTGIPVVQLRPDLADLLTGDAA